MQVGDKVIWKDDYKPGRELEIAEIHQYQREGVNKGRTVITLRIYVGSLIDVWAEDVRRG